MKLELNILSVILILSAALTLFIALLLFQRSNAKTQAFSFVAFAIAFWSFSYGIELSGRTMAAVLFWARLEYLGIALLPALWVIAIIRFVDKGKWLNTPLYSLIFLIPVLTLLIVWTDSWHHTFYTDTDLSRSGSLVFLNSQKGPWYTIFTAYFYIMLAFGIYLLISSFYKSDKVYRKQVYLILIGVLIPWAFNFLYQIGFRPYNHLDITPFTFIFVTFIIGLGLLRFHLFDIVPMAREMIIEVMQEGVLVLDSRNRVIDINPEMKKILAIGNVPIGIDFSELFPQNETLNEAINKKTNYSVEIKLNNPAGDKIYSVTTTCVYDDGGAYNGSILLFKDLSELRAKEAIKELMEKKDEFLSIASHELKTPLTSMKGYLQIMQKMSEKDEVSPYKNFIFQAGRQVNKLTALINDLLDVSKIQAGELQYNFADFVLHEVIADGLNFAGNIAPEHIIVVKGNTGIRVEADKLRIEQVICNLLSNAIKYAPDSRQIILEVIEETAHIKVSVTDFGIGIPKEKQNELFQKFYRIESGNLNFPGLGIGLFLSAQIINRHNGKMGVISEANQGSTFYFTLPLDRKNIQGKVDDLQKNIQFEEI